eukprot:TRINITY_DN2842_c0_g2_i10.p1 TRINITY_DN2842_c0_g2~~TRINITY_DN2842_c0_g2_i10.p1  ORF type:complete len:2789 (-),score=856.42 TRINITY_DN2842_c0_g2_i10:989-9238(-)
MAKPSDSFRMELQAMENNLKNANLIELQRYLTNIEQEMYAAVEGKLDEARFLFFIKMMLPRYQMTLLKRIDLSPEGAARVNKFLLGLINYCLGFIPKYNDIEIYQTLYRCINEDNPFYTKYRGEPEEDETEYSGMMSSKKSYLPKLLLQNLQYFNSLNGPKVLLDRIKNNNPPPSIAMIRFIIKSIMAVYTLLTPQQFHMIVEELYSAVNEKVLKITDEELSADDDEKIAITDISNGMKSLLNEIWQQPQKSEEWQLDYRLKFAYKGLTSGVLKKRLGGLADLYSILSECTKSHSSDPERFRSRTALKWMRENKILEYIFVTSVHAEILKKSFELSHLLAYNQFFEEKDIDMIWNAMSGKHESIRQLICQVLTHASQGFEPQLLEFLFSKVKTVPIESLDVNLVVLIQKIAIGYVYKQQTKPLKVIGLEELWTLLQDESNLPQPSRQMAIWLFCEVFNFNWMSTFRLTYIEKCLQNIDEGKTVTISQSILVSIIGTYNNGKVSDIHQTKIEDVVQWLESERQILHLFFKDLNRYHSHATETMKNLGIENPDTYSFSTSPHSEQISSRLDFLKSLLSSSNLKLSEKHADIFWDILVTGALSDAARDRTFNWLEVARSSNWITDETTQFIFTEKVPTLNFEKMSAAGLSFFEFYLRYINWQHSKFDQPSSNNYTVNSFEIIGRENLWKIALEALDANVGKNAIKTLLQLFKNESLGPQRELFVQTCMAHLEKETASELRESNKKHQIVIERCLLTLQMFLDMFEVKLGINTLRHGSLGQAKKPTLMKISFKMINGNVFSIEVMNNLYVGSIRQLVAEKCGFEGAARLIFQGKEVFDEVPVTDLKSLVHVVQKVKSSDLPKGKGNGNSTQSSSENPHSIDSKWLPSNLLSQQKYFDILLGVLRLGKIFAKMAWDILMLLPTNEAAKLAIADLNGEVSPNWDFILNSSSTYALLYSLQIIESQLNGSEEEKDETKMDVEGESKQNGAWSEKFLALGGLKYLFELFISKDFIAKENGPKRKVCLLFLLKTIKSFVAKTTLNEDSLPVVTPNYQLMSESVKLPPFVDKLIQVLVACSMKQEDEEEILPSEDSSIGRYCVEFLSYSGRIDPTIPVTITSLPSFEQFLKTVLLDSSNKEIREAVKDLLLSMTSPLQNHEIHRVVLDASLRILSQLGEREPTGEQFFALLDCLISEKCDGYNGGLPQDFLPLLNHLNEMIKKHPIIEARGSKEEDVVLIGRLQLIRSILKRLPQVKVSIGNEGGLISEVFEKCLFDIPTPENHANDAPPKCKSEASRKAAFLLLVELTIDCPQNFQMISQKFLSHHTDVSLKRDMWHFSPSSMEKSDSGYVGLRNLGATCYMNSLMQQLYMIPHFRYGLLSVNVEEIVAQNSANVDEKLKESNLFQMQKMMSNLQEGETKYFDTRGFASSCKFDGQPVDTSVQMDADEFFNTLFDQIENALKGTNKQNLLADFFGGMMCNQVISKECGHVSERDENFFTLSLEVKGKKSVTDSLSLYVQGDPLEGENKYFCGQCERKVDALRRSCIKKLPDNLIVHAKRFEFDMELMRRVKVNDYFEFPTTLDMEPFTLEGLTRRENNADLSKVPLSEEEMEAYTYELAGILVHEGTADGGHYYSFIKEREFADGRQRRWLHFNDSDVEYWDPKGIPNVGYGGITSANQWDPQLSKNVHRTFEKMNNGYMLFYERVKPQKVDNKRLDFSEESKVVPEKLFNAIWNENMTFLMEKNIYDGNYFGFLWSMLSSTAQSPKTVQFSPFPKAEDAQESETGSKMEAEPSFDALLQCIQLGTKLIFVTMIHAKEKRSLSSFVDQLKGWYSKHQEACRWFLRTLTEDPTWIRQGLLYNSNSESRGALVRLVIHVISLLAPLERPEYTISEPKEDYVKLNYSLIDFSHKFKSTVISFVEKVMELMPEAPFHWVHFSEYFALLREFATLGVPEAEHLVKRGILPQLVDFFLNDTSPSWLSLPVNERPRRVKMGDKFTKPNWDLFVDLMSTLVRSCLVLPPDLQTLDPLPPQPPSLIEGRGIYEPEALSFLAEQKFFFEQIMSQQAGNPVLVAKIIQHLSWENENFSDMMVGIISHGIDYHKESNMKPFLESILLLCYTADHLQSSRVENTLQGFMRSSIKNSTYSAESKTCMGIFLDLVKKRDNPDTIKFVYTNRKLFIEAFLFHKDDAVRDITAHIFTHLTSDTPSDFLNVYPQLNAEEKMEVERSTDPSNDEMRYNILRSLWEFIPGLYSNYSKLKDLDGGIGAVWYLRLIRFFSISEKDKSLLVEFCSVFQKTYVYFNKNTLEMNKAELVALLYHLLQGSTTNVAVFSSNTAWFEDYFTFNITLNPNNESYYKYHNATLPLWFSILNTLCQHSPQFLREWIKHSNFGWAYNSFHNDAANYPKICAVLEETRRLAEADEVANEILHAQPKQMSKEEKSMNDLHPIILQLENMLINPMANNLNINVACEKIYKLSDWAFDEEESLGSEARKILDQMIEMMEPVILTLIDYCNHLDKKKENQRIFDVIFEFTMQSPSLFDKVVEKLDHIFNLSYTSNRVPSLLLMKLALYLCQRAKKDLMNLVDTFPLVLSSLCCFGHLDGPFASFWEQFVVYTVESEVREKFENEGPGGRCFALLKHLMKTPEMRNNLTLDFFKGFYSKFYGELDKEIKYVFFSSIDAQLQSSIQILSSEDSDATNKEIRRIETKLLFALNAVKSKEDKELFTSSCSDSLSCLTALLPEDCQNINSILNEINSFQG